MASGPESAEVGDVVVEGVGADAEQLRDRGDAGIGLGSMSRAARIISGMMTLGRPPTRPRAAPVLSADAIRRMRFRYKSRTTAHYVILSRLIPIENCRRMNRRQRT